MSSHRQRELARRAPELLHFAALHATLCALERTLLAEHPTLHELEPRSPPSVLQASLLLAKIRSLRRRMQLYRRAAIRAIRPPPRKPLLRLVPSPRLPCEPDLPF